MLGMYAFSRAGHDKTQLYIIIEEEEEYVYVADGKNKTIEKPKRKNKKHIQVMKKNADDGIAAALRNNQAVSNEAIKKAIKEVLSDK